MLLFGVRGEGSHSCFRFVLPRLHLLGCVAQMVYLVGLKPHKLLNLCRDPLDTTIILSFPFVDVGN